jgi:putative polyhydroxyalkanoate system protein
MSKIHMRRGHTMTEDELKDGLQEIADHLSDNFGMTSSWKGNEIHFSKSGAKGAKGVLAIAEGELKLEMQLGMLLKPFKSKIVSEMEKFLDENLK